MKRRFVFTSIFVMILVLGVCFVISLFVHEILHGTELIPAIFALGVLLVSVLTRGYIYGIISSVLSVLAVNFAFALPYFRFNFTMPENIISATIFLIVTIITCSLAIRVKKQEMIKAESNQEKMRANLLRAVSHDLRTPLTTIYGSSTALLENFDNFTPEQCKTILCGISEDSLWLNQMVENLLSVTKLDGGNVKVIKSDTVLEELIDSVLIKFSKRYPSQKIDISLPDEFVSIPMDALLIEQVLINILENAIHHAEGMTRLFLRVYIASDKAVFEVEDDGCGIPKDKIKDIFAGVYSKQKNLSDNKKNNAGIGLSVCASIIKAHGGEIKAQNKKNSGALLRFVLNMEE